MKLKNNFPAYAWTTFMDGWSCWLCGMNTADCLHHIVGRGGMSKPACEFSILNAAPMCNNKCHLPNHGKITTDEYKKKFLQKTYNYLKRNGYRFIAQDARFVRKYEQYYSRNQITNVCKNINESNVFGDSLEQEEPVEERLPPVYAPIQEQDQI